MANNNYNNFGDTIQKLVDRAVQNGEFNDLSRAIGDAINETIDIVKDNIRSNINYHSRPGDLPPYEKGTHWQRTTEGWEKATDQNAKSVSKNDTSQWNTIPHVKKKAETMPVPYQKKPNKTVGIIFSILGLILLIIFGLFTAIFGIGLALGISNGILAVFLVFTILTVLSILLLMKGVKRINLIGRFLSYTKTIGNQLNVPIKQLAQESHRSIEAVTTDLRKMIAQSLFYQAHIDEEDKVLLLTDESYQTYRSAKLDYQARLEKEKKETEHISPEVQKLLADGNNYIGKIHHYNDEIPGEPITSKLNQMESIVAEIFALVKKHPEIATDLNQMMDYYLPTTIKLLDTYRELDRQTTQAENITNTKAEIETAIDTLNGAFHTLFNDLFEDTAWDISSDISVLNTKLAQEGLTSDGLHSQKQ